MKIMLVVSAAGQIMKPLVVLSGIEERYGKLLNGSYETAYEYLPKPNYLHMRPISGVNTNIFTLWRRYLLTKGRPCVLMSLGWFWFWMGVCVMCRLGHFHCLETMVFWFLGFRLMLLMFYSLSMWQFLDH